jgi:uncharacterized lipoprotein YbaY
MEMLMKQQCFLHYVLFPLISVLFLVGCSTVSPVDEPPVESYELFTGVVNYPGNLYFPSRVRLVITLNEHDIFDGSASLVVSQTINNPQRFPVNYTLRYLSEEIDSSNFFSISYKLYRGEEDEPFLFAQSKKVRESELHNPVNIFLKPF